MLPLLAGVFYSPFYTHPTAIKSRITTLVVTRRMGVFVDALKYVKRRTKIPVRIQQTHNDIGGLTHP